MAWVLSRLAHVSLRDVALGVVGLSAGLVLAFLIGFPLSRIPGVGNYLALGAAIALGYLGYHLVMQRRDELAAPRARLDRSGRGGAKGRGTPKVLDTSVIIDGRVVDVVKAGFLEGPLLVSRSVLAELQRIADSSDSLRRNRGRRGLDVLHRLQQELQAVQIVDDPKDGGGDVDSALVALAKSIRGWIVTNDFNLNKVAAGRGERLGGALPKAFVPVAGVPMLLHAARRVELSPLVERIVVVVGAPDVDRARVLLTEHGLRKVASVVPGGTHRQDSVYAGLSQLDEAPVSVVHDGARPLVTPEMVTAVILAAAEAGAASAGLPVRETVKLIEGRDARQTLDRDQLWVAHTPQAFRTPLLREAHRRARTDGFYGTDDAVLIERLGHAVRMIEDSPRNLKVTVPADLELAGVYLREWSGQSPQQYTPADSWGVGRMVRTGVGYDAHRLVMGRTLRLGGVEIPSPRGLGGHSAADVLVHAIMDALLGGAGLGDIGRDFPPVGPADKGLDSIPVPP